MKRIQAFAQKARQEGRHIYIRGARGIGVSLGIYLDYIGIPFAGYIDRNEKKQNQVVFENHRCFPPEKTEENSFVFIAAESRSVEQEIEKELNAAGIPYLGDLYEPIMDCMKSIEPQFYLTRWYFHQTGKQLDWNHLVTFDEKLQWMKIYDSTPLKKQLSDKYLVRDWVAEKIGEEYLVPLLGVWDSFDEIDFDALPRQFVLKCNHGSGMNAVVYNKSDENWSIIREKFNRWMKINYALQEGLELCYFDIKPKILAEAYMENKHKDLFDYKVFCFNGRAESIMFLSERAKGLKMAFYDLNWNKLPYTYSYQRNEATVPPPKNLKKLIALAERLASGFAHVRVDFYVLNDGTIKFGEMTFYSLSGVCKWSPPEQDKIFGDLIRLPQKEQDKVDTEKKVW